MGRGPLLLPCSSAAIRFAPGCGDGGRICNPAAAQARPQCVGKRFGVGSLRDRRRNGAKPRRVVFVLAIVVASGASFGVQITAAITFVIATLTVQEIILVSHLARPAKTQAFLRRLNDWALAHQRKLVVAIFAVVGVSLMAQGMGGA